MATLNVKNRTLFTGDNLDVMRGMNSHCVDLIYLDPPFNSNRDYAAPIGSEAAGAAFKDTWTLSDVDVAWIGLIADRDPALAHIIESAGLAHGKSMQAYLTMMAVRLLEMRRILRPSGSIYVHCDPTASHYLKLVMDCVFGSSWFRNELVWKRTTSHSDAKRYASVSDRLLFYASDSATWHTQHLPFRKTYLSSHYSNEDERGRYQVGDLTGSGLRDGESGEPWGGYDPSGIGRHWGVPSKGAYAQWIEENLIPGYKSMPGVHARLDALSGVGLVHWTKTGTPRLKRYLQASHGEAVSDFISDILNVNHMSKEHVGYPTQKPLALLERIIKASSNESDVVFDPFCGCATALVAAEKLDRNWIGIDLSALAVRLVLSRLEQAADDGALLQGGRLPDVHHRKDIPKRTDVGELPPYKTHRHTLYGKQEGNCAGCGIHFPFRNLTVDHIVPQSRGGTDHLENLQLLCGACNSMKGTISQAAFHAKLTKQGLR
ncbi:MAG: site-specific DNA-methyltransferase [Acidobacteriia bacterium]|nr:site-specific DNA-methyltransferase [Terriglobia bacterium]MYG02553.1 site-specific DNA-methyltransferase [Terriglobia bacterium]MYK08036.1 site-specific DNA-methyltransferase [Terriglobia bacterium]